MKNELSEVKVPEFQNSIGLDTSIRRSFERLQEGKFSQSEKKLAPDIKQSFEHLQKDGSASERMSSGVAKSFEKLEQEPGTRYNDSGAPYRMEQDLLSDAEYKRNGYENIQQTTLEDFSQRKEIFT